MGVAVEGVCDILEQSRAGVLARMYPVGDIWRRGLSSSNEETPVPSHALLCLLIARPVDDTSEARVAMQRPWAT